MADNVKHTDERRKATFFSRQITFGSIINAVSMAIGLVAAVIAYQDFKHDTGLRLVKLEAISGEITRVVAQQQNQINLIFDRILPGDHARR
jgi:hypothetical protein